MVIEFLFNEIKDKTKLYSVEYLPVRLEFDDEPGSVLCEHYIGNKYCRDAMEIAKNSLNGIIYYEYKGALERIANEVFELRSDSANYTVSCTIDTYASDKTRMLVQITSENSNENENSNGTANALEKYDHLLEKLKLEVKNVFRDDWESCVWIRDEQSEFLCSNLYSYIFRAENRLRAFANKVLIWELGTNWLESPGLEKYAESHKSLSEAFRRREPAFSDVDDVFISTTLETLFEIIQKGIVYESPFQLSQVQFNELIKLTNKKIDVSGWLNKKRSIRKNLWKDIFEPYFVSTTNSQQIITDFILNRNHIAHNKPLTWAAYKTMKKSFIDLDDMIKKANEQFERSVPSEELYLTMDIQNEEERDAEEQLEYEKNYIRDRISATGVEILWYNQIFDMFLENASDLYQKIHDIYYWDSRFTVSAMYVMEDTTDWQTLFSVKCNACKTSNLEVQVSHCIDDEMDSDSTLTFRCIIHEEDGLQAYTSTKDDLCATMYYHNGSGYENIEEGGTIELTSESTLDESEMDEFVEELKTAIEEFNPYIAIKESMEEAAAREGADPIVADLPCWECEQYGVSLNDDFYKFGHCCYCGSDNEVCICQRCGSPFGDGDGKLGLCNNCITYIEEQ